MATVPSPIRIIDKELDLEMTLYRKYCDKATEKSLYETILRDLVWYRVCYKSERHQNECETPCWTNFFGGFEHVKPYQALPSCLRDINDKVAAECGVPFNAVLVRLYLDGNDNIAWHTDGRAFLGPRPVIASLSLGSKAKFQMRHMTDVWPSSKTPNGGVNKAVPVREWDLGGGDMIVMSGKTQSAWHHRVPQEKGRGPRININFRHILPQETAVDGVRTYYKYMVSGDDKSSDWDITARAYTYQEVVARQAPLLAFLRGNGPPAPTPPPPLPTPRLGQASISTPLAPSHESAELRGDLMMPAHPPPASSAAAGPAARRPTASRVCAAAAAAAAGPAAGGPARWACAACTYANLAAGGPRAQRCIMCDTPRAAPQAAAAGGKAAEAGPARAVPDRDWPGGGASSSKRPRLVAPAAKE